jgi:hypothetical protein
MAALGATLALVAACGQLPTPDKVRTVRHIAADAPDVGAPEVRKLPAGPLPGEQPADVVRGFIAAAADPSDRHGLARSFLARGAKWDDAASLVVYDPSSLTTSVAKDGADRAVVSLRMSTDLVADRDGGYRPSLTTVTRRYEVIRSDGQWRLANVPAGVLVTSRDVARSYRTVRLYAISATGDMLVPDPVLLVTDRPALPTTAVRAQLRAPTDWLSTAAGTAVPPDASLLGSATLVDQQVTADLSLPNMPTAPAVRLALVAQLRTMLGQLPGVKQVRLLIDGTDAAVPPGNAPVDPDSTPPDGPAVAVVAGRLLPVGPAHQGGTEASTAAAVVGNTATSVSAGIAGELAAVTSSGTLLWRTGSYTSMAAAPGTWRSASWVRSLGLLGVEKATGALAFLPVHGGATAVDDGGLGKLGPVSEVAVSRDGARVAAIAGPPGARRVYLGRLAYTPPFATDNVSGQTPTVVGAGGWTPVTAVGDDVRAVDWSSSLGLAVIVGDQPRGPAVVKQIPLDGLDEATTLSMRGLPEPADAIAAAPGEPILVSSGGRIWRYDDTGAGHWLAIGAGNLPAYPA